MLYCNHGDRFWAALSYAMPDWRMRKAQLDWNRGRRGGEWG
ncbi:M48 family metalloprotease [Anabaena azotica]|uniref:M48 family metallopeptidase n=1 Tax=Anabaena azotica FACHB-119 TaxID=947527 RepID=A0ABR8DBU0_9NOST|nr:M48 family metallopeptidase [Anabaena azotica FACHB-119]